METKITHNNPFYKTLSIMKRYNLTVCEPMTILNFMNRNQAEILSSTDQTQSSNVNALSIDQTL